MNKEEAIEYLKNYKYDNEVRQAINTVLDYIADLEKENAVKESNFKIVSKYNEELEKEVEQLKVNEEILMKTKGCLDKDGSTDCRVLESLSYGIRAYEKTLRNSVHKDKIRDKIEEWDKSIKWNNADDHYYAIKILKELLEEGD